MSAAALRLVDAAQPAESPSDRADPKPVPFPAEPAADLPRIDPVLLERYMEALQRGVWLSS